MLHVPRSVHPPHGRHVHPVLGCETRFRPVFSDTLASVLTHGWTRAFNNRPMKRELPSSNGNFSSRVTYYSRLSIFRCHFFTLYQGIIGFEILILIISYKKFNIIFSHILVSYTFKNFDILLTYYD